MPALNFKKRFAEAVEAGWKLQTIRAPRKRPIKPGDRLYLYTGMRTKGCRKLGEGRCTATTKIGVREHGITCGLQIVIARWRESFAELDGFGSWIEMREWFRKEYELPFTGVLIEWRKEK